MKKNKAIAREIKRDSKETYIVPLKKIMSLMMRAMSTKISRIANIL